MINGELYGKVNNHSVFVRSERVSDDGEAVSSVPVAASVPAADNQQGDPISTTPTLQLDQSTSESLTAQQYCQHSSAVGQSRDDPPSD